MLVKCGRRKLVRSPSIQSTLRICSRRVSVQSVLAHYRGFVGKLVCAICIQCIHCLSFFMFIAEVNSARTNLSPFTKGYRGLASRMQFVYNLCRESPLGAFPPPHSTCSSLRKIVTETCFNFFASLSLKACRYHLPLCCRRCPNLNRRLCLCRSSLFLCRPSAIRPPWPIQLDSIHHAPSAFAPKSGEWAECWAACTQVVGQ